MTDFNDVLNGVFNRPVASEPVGVKVHGHKQGDDYYVRADDIADLLDANNVLPTIAAKLRKANDA